MRLGLTTEGAETPVRAARKEACERIRFAQLGRNSPTLDGRQMICGRGVDEWHEVRLPPSSFRAPRSGFPRFQWLTDLSTAPRIKCAPSPDRGIDNSALSAQMDLTLFVYTQSAGVRFESVETFRRWHCHTQSATDSICRRPAPIGLVSLHFDFPFVRGDKSNRSHSCRMFGQYAIPDT